MEGGWEKEGEEQRGLVCFSENNKLQNTILKARQCHNGGKVSCSVKLCFCSDFHRAFLVLFSQAASS